jgi:hypothetical protein
VFLSGRKGFVRVAIQAGVGARLHTLPNACALGTDPSDGGRTPSPVLPMRCLCQHGVNESCALPLWLSELCPAMWACRHPAGVPLGPLPDLHRLGPRETQPPPEDCGRRVLGRVPPPAAPQARPGVAGRASHTRCARRISICMHQDFVAPHAAQGYCWSSDIS